MEMRIVIARILWSFDVRLGKGQGVPQLDHRALAAGNLNVILTPVKR
jgi:hypothetical protein